jgi:tetrahydromethanopterin S-methyltransferase subunit G
MNNNVELPKLDKEPIKDDNINNENTNIYKEMFKYVTTKSGKDLGMLVLNVGLVVILIIFLKLPFDLIRDAGFSFIQTINNSFAAGFIDKWNALFNIIYCVLGIILFLKIVKKRFINLNKAPKQLN